MAKAGGGGGAGAGGNGALTWVVSGGRRRAGVLAAALFPARGGGGIPPGGPGVGRKGKEREIRRPGRAPRRGFCQQNPPLPAPFLSLPLWRLRCWG